MGLVVHSQATRLERLGLGGYPAIMTESAPTPIELPSKSPEELAEIHARHERIRQRDLSGLVNWEEVADVLGLPSAAHRPGPSPAP